MRKREVLVKWEHFCRWFRRIGFYILVAFVMTSNFYMFLERNEAEGNNVTLASENNRLKEQNDSLRSDYIKKIGYKQTIDSFTTKSLKQLLAAEKIKAEIMNEYRQHQDSLKKIRK